MVSRKAHNLEIAGSNPAPAKISTVSSTKIKIADAERPGDFFMESRHQREGENCGFYDISCQVRIAMPSCVWEATPPDTNV